MDRIVLLKKIIEKSSPLKYEEEARRLISIGYSQFEITCAISMLSREINNKAQELRDRRK